MSKAPPSALSAARLAAVQALYEIELSGAPADPVLDAFLEGRWRVAGPEDDASLDGTKMVPPDRQLLSDLVGGVHGMGADLDGLLTGHLSQKHDVESLEMLVRIILRSAAFELRERLQVPARVVIGEYLDIARAFFDGKEPGLINGVLDSVTRAVRPGELPDARSKGAGAA